MVKVILHGCNGKMGQMVTELCSQDEDIKIVAVVSRRDIHLTVRQRKQFGDLGDIPASLLHAHNILHIPAKSYHGLRQNIAAGPAGHVVKESTRSRILRMPSL